MLSPYRVLDLTDHRGHLTGAALAALGADVVAIEPPGGSAARRVAPYATGVEGPEASLTHFAYNRNKRSVVLDLTTPHGREDLLRLVDGADVLIESEDPGRLASLGLDATTLLARNPALVVASLTPFGQDGPKAGWAHTDLTLMASGCTLAFTGDADRAPVRVATPQGYHFGAASAIGGILLALHQRAVSGCGQHIDVAAQCTVALGTQAGVLASGANAPTPTRTAGGAKAGIIELRFVYPAADGWVSITHVFGTAIGPGTARLMQWAQEEGHCDAELAGKDWANYAVLLESGEEPLENWQRARDAVEALCRSKTKAELLAGAMTRNLYLAPISSPRDVVESNQLRHRSFFAPVEHPATGRTVEAPAFFAKVRGPELPRLGRAPLLGEHTREVLEEAPRSPAVGTPTHPGSTALPLAGLKVLDFTWSIAGPHHTRVLADAGATVVKVESARRPDAARGFLPVHDNAPGAEQSALFDDMNAGKLSLGIDLSVPESMDVIHDLVRWADVVTESYTPKAMRAWGLDYENLRRINPSIVMLSTCLAGQDGPLASFAGFGNLGAALAGFYGLAGWPDRPPAGPFGAYTDYTSTHFILGTLLAALDHRRRTGEGAFIDLAQSEAATWFLAPALLEWTVNGVVAERAGNRDRDLAPHGVYPAAGTDRWVAIACRDDRDWSALAELLGRTDLAALPIAERHRRHDELDELIAAWTSTRSDAEAEAALQARGVPAHLVASSVECLADPQLAYRGHFVDLDHPSRRCLVERTRFALGRTPTVVERRPPFLGEHNAEILGGLLGYDDDQVADLVIAGALE